MISFIPFLFSFVFGFAFLAVFVGKSSLPNKILFLISVSAPAGFAMWSLLLFFAYVIIPRHAPLIYYSSAICLAAACFVILVKNPLGFPKCFGFCRINFRDYFKQNSLEEWAKRALFIIAVLVFFYQFGIFIKIFLSRMVYEVHGDWDARFFWVVKAKFYVRDPDLWKGMFSGLIEWTHQDYPLLIPGAIAWGWNWFGREVLIWQHIVDLSFTVSLLLLIFWYLMSYASITSALFACSALLSIDFFRYYGSANYADIPLAFFFAASTVMLVVAIRLKEWRLFFLSGLFAGFSAWTKNEGVLFIVWNGIVFGIFLMWHRRRGIKDNFRHVLAWVCGISVSFTALIILKTQLAPYGEYFGSGRSVSELFLLIFGNLSRSRFIAQSFFDYMFRADGWNYFWYLFAFSLAYGSIFYRAVWAKKTWLYAVMVLLVEFGYYIFIHISPMETRIQIVTALNRMLLHSVALAVIFIFETVQPLVAKKAAL